MMRGANPPDVSIPDAGKFQQAMQGAEAGLWHWDLTTNAVSLSPNAITLLGRPWLEAFNYTRFLDLIDQSDRANVDKTLRDSAAAAGHFDFGFRTRVTGHWIRARAQGFSNEAAGILILANRCSVTQQPNRRPATIVTSLADAIVGEAPDGTTTDWNRGAETIFGYSAPKSSANRLRPCICQNMKTKPARHATA